MKHWKLFIFERLLWTFHVVLLTLVACDRPPPEPPEPPPIVEDDAGSVEPAPSCDTACSYLRDRECEAGNPTPSGATCEQVCENTSSTPMEWDVVCLTDALGCGQCGY